MSAYLLQGKETQEKLQLLFELGRFTSEDIKYALTLHFVKGYPVAMAYQTADIKQQNLARGIIKINRIYKLACDIAEL